MKIEQIYTGCLSQGSYYIESNGEVAIIDPLREISNYLKLANDQYIGAITSLGYYVHPQYEDIQLHGNYYSLKDSLFVTLIQSNGRVIVKPEDEIQEVFGYSEGYFHVLKDGKHGFIDENGKLRVANRYDEALPYNEGLAPIKLLGRWGFIDKAEILKIQLH